MFELGISTEMNATPLTLATRGAPAVANSDAIVALCSIDGERTTLTPRAHVGALSCLSPRPYRSHWVPG